MYRVDYDSNHVQKILSRYFHQKEDAKQYMKHKSFNKENPRLTTIDTEAELLLMISQHIIEWKPSTISKTE